MSVDFAKQHPVASIVVPTFNRADLLRRMVPLLAEQETKEPYEVIVVDNNSTDDTMRVLSEAGLRWPHVTSVKESRQGAGPARHAGALVARAPVLIFIDDDMLADPNVLAEHLRVHRDYPGGCVIGNILSAPGRHPFQRMMAYIYDGPRMTLQQRQPRAEDCWTGHLSLPRDVYFTLGGFSNDLAEWGEEDLEFGCRLVDAGIQLRYVREAVTHHHFTARFGPAIRRSYQSGQALGYIMDRYPGMVASGPERVTAGWRARAVERACQMAAGLLEPFSRGEGTPFVPLSFVYGLGLRTATGRGLRDYLLRGQKNA
jgi:glycosyltransferase involved in cell wall biosynthesis